MAQYENRWRDEGRDWRDEDRWRGEGRRYGGDRDEYGSGERSAGGRPDWQGGREVYRGYVGNESGGFGRDTHGRDTARESERVYGRTFGGGRDESRSGFGGYGSGYGGRSGSSGFGGYGGGGYGGTGRDERDRYRGEADYSRGYGAGYGERDLGRNYGSQYGQRDYGRDYERDQRHDYSGDTSRGYGAERGYGGYGESRGRDMGHRDMGHRDMGQYNPRRGRVEERGFWEQAGDEIASWFGDDDAERRRHQDEARAAQNRGRGPRGYSRSDDRVREDVNDRLTDDPYIDASEIDVSVSKGEVTLSGTVTHRSAKRRAEDIAEAVSGVTHVQNNLRVRQQTGTGMGTSTGAGASAMAGAGTGTGTGMGTGTGAGSVASGPMGATTGGTGTGAVSGSAATSTTPGVRRT